MMSGLASGELGLPEGRLAMSRAVSADMEAIFRDVPAALEAGPAARVTPMAPARGGRSMRRGPYLLALLAAGGLGLVGGSLIADGPRSIAAPSPAPILPVEVAARPDPEPVAVAEPEPVVVKVRTRAPKPRAASKPTLVAGCPSPCGRADVAAADRNLRRAYTRAVRAGVPRPVLATYRERWDDLRHGARDEPRRLVRAYGSLAMGLETAAHTARTGDT